MGPTRNGSVAEKLSGDIFLAFSTRNRAAADRTEVVNAKYHEHTGQGSGTGYRSWNAPPTWGQGLRLAGSFRLGAGSRGWRSTAFFRRVWGSLYFQFSILRQSLI